MLKQMNISENGINLIKELEGCKLYTYDDVTGKQVYLGQHYKGTLTIGFGHTGKDVKAGDVITEEKAIYLLKSDLESTEKAINSLVTVAITQNQYDALCSFVFNIGAGNFKKSAVLKNINKKCFKLAADSFKNWHRGNGIPHILDKRREKEKALFIK